MQKTRLNRKTNVRDSSALGSVRIIGGEWRGRKLPVIEANGLRPSSDRIRETLFNWLMPYVAGSRCLDLFAGTGALGFESLSRGAAHVDFVETQCQVFGALESNISLLNAQASVWHESAESYLRRIQGNQGAKKYDIVFIDPPFAGDLLESTISQICTTNCLKSGSWVYIESSVNQAFSFPATWGLHREKQTKQVASRLFLID